MKVAVCRETRSNERRVALVPGQIERLQKLGLEVVIEAGAGTAAGFLDADYSAAGARVESSMAATLEGAGIVLWVQSPPEGEAGSTFMGAIPSGAVVIGLMNPLGSRPLMEDLARRNLTGFALEMVPRITRAQKMDVLSSQATVAGYKASLIAAHALPKFFPMLMTAAGTIPPARALILGAGVAGLQAIATCRRLGAVVEAFDVRPAVREQVQSLGATFLEAELDESAEDEGGYAKALSEDQHKKELEVIAKHVVDADIIITTAQIPGKPAPLLITEEMLRTMRPGSVVVDLASESGGNCAATREGETVHFEGVTVMGPVNIPGTLPFHASQMYASNLVAFLELLAPEGEVQLNFEDEILDQSCVTHAGAVRADAPARSNAGEEASDG